jgi:hypothetical protein
MPAAVADLSRRRAALEVVLQAYGNLFLDIGAAAVTLDTRRQTLGDALLIAQPGADIGRIAVGAVL